MFNINSRRLLNCLLIVAALAFSTTAQQPSDKNLAASNHQVSTTLSGDEVYRIGPGDVLNIRIYSKPQLGRDAVRVEGNGMIRMPLIETDIQAACRTEGELARDISTRYAKFYKN